MNATKMFHSNIQNLTYFWFTLYTCMKLSSFTIIFKIEDIFGYRLFIHVTINFHNNTKSLACIKMHSHAGAFNRLPALYVRRSVRTYVCVYVLECIVIAATVILLSCCLLMGTMIIVWCCYRKVNNNDFTHLTGKYVYLALLLIN